MDKISETDPWYTDMKRFKKEEQRRRLLADGCDGIPTKCPCGAPIVVEPSHLSGSDVGRRYLICSEYEEDNDQHLKKLWVHGLEEEVTKLQNENAKLKEELKEVAKLKARLA